MSVVPTRPTMLLATLHHSARRAVVCSGSGSGGMAQPGGGDVDELAMPQLEHQQRPDALGVAVGAGRVAVEQRRDGLAARSSRASSVLGSSRISRAHALQVAAQPARQRDREALLGPVEDVAGQPAAQRLAEDPLLLAAADLERRRGSRRRAPSARGRGTASAPRARAPSWRCRSSRSGRRRGRSRRRPRASGRRPTSPDAGRPARARSRPGSLPPIRPRTRACRAPRRCPASNHDT